MIEVKASLSPMLSAPPLPVTRTRRWWCVRCIMTFGANVPGQMQPWNIRHFVPLLLSPCPPPPPYSTPLQMMQSPMGRVGRPQ